MSKTYRRTGKESYNWKWHCYEYEFDLNSWATYKRYFEHNSKEWKREKAKFHSDAFWGRNRRCYRWFEREFHKSICNYNEREIHKFFRYVDYEPVFVDNLSGNRYWY